jgi:hypothetical protein
MKRMRIPKLDVVVWAAIGVAVVVGVGLAFWLVKGVSITVSNPQGHKLVSSTGPLTGLPCADATRRPIAVMLASDAEARPLSGLVAADMVFEMPVTPDGITRMMAVYQCHEPKEIGSIRSARSDFIPLVQGLNAVYAHWGGERDALVLLNEGITDNVDALKYEGSTFYRKRGIPRPHNGFTTLELVRERADALDYAASASISPYPRAKAKPERNLGTIASEVSVPWRQDMDVVFLYDPSSNRYLRSRAGTPEIDADTGAQIGASVVVVMKTDARTLYDQYLAVRTVGSGDAAIYQDGRRATARWNKRSPTDTLTFTDASGKPLALTPGPIWVLVDAPLP